MRTRTIRVAAIAAMCAAPVLVAAQHEGHGAGGDAALCVEAQPAVTQTLEGAMARLETARQSNAAAAMRAAVADLQVALVTLKTLLAPCAAGKPAAPQLAPAATSPSSAIPLEITFRPQAPPSTGSSTFEVTVKDLAGKPVIDADVSVVLFMAAMPSIGMPAMRNEAPLSHATEGVYRGAGQIMMAGPWDVTVTVIRGKQQVSKQFALVAK